MNSEDAFTTTIAPGWTLVMDLLCIDRWKGNDVMPKVLAAVAHADGTVKASARPLVSDDLIIEVEPEPCIAVLMKFPPSPAWLRGVVWIGTRQEVIELRESMRSENVGRFKAVALDPNSN